MNILMNNFSNKYKEHVLRQDEEVTYIWKTLLCKFFGNNPLKKPLI